MRSSEVPEWMRAEWRIAQELSAVRAGQAAFAVHPEHFVIKAIVGPFECGGVMANGCFTHGLFTTPTIRWNTETPSVIRHEGQHAILWKLGHPDFKCVEHSC